MTDIENNVIDACIDAPDNQDWDFSDFIEVGGDAKTRANKRFPVDDLEVIDQSAFYETRAGCTQAGPLNISNAQNILEYKASGLKYEQQELFPIRKEYNKNRGEKMRKGDSLQNGIRNIRRSGLISGYAKIRSIDDLKIAIDQGNFIATGSANGDRRNVRLKKEYRTVKGFVGHMFCIVGYDKNGMIGLNSYGNKNGYFNIDRKYFDFLYSKYAIFDKSDQEKVNKFKEKNEFELMIGKMKALGITNAERLNENISRAEAIVMIGRLYNLLKK